MRLNSPSTGRLDPGIVQRDALIQQTIEFVWSSLLPWREEVDCSFPDAEEELNGDINDFLDIRAREHCPMVFFRHEQKEEKNRRVDMAAKPVRPVLIQGKIYMRRRPILLIEGKRLPAPPPKVREKEYLTGQPEISGGVQRFKLGLHGKEHEVAILLGYIQKGTPKDWHKQINIWVEELASAHPESWSHSECLSTLTPQKAETHSRCSSSHLRTGKCRTTRILLHHFWISIPIPATKEASQL
jgi:hypothetical protein